MTGNGLNGNDFIHRELGKMAATLGAIQANQQEANKETAEHRKEFGGLLKDIDERLAIVERLSTSNTKAIAEDVMPTVKEVKAWKQRGIGFLAFAGMAGTGFGVVLMKYADSIKAGVSEFFK